MKRQRTSLIAFAILAVAAVIAVVAWQSHRAGAVAGIRGVAKVRATVRVKRTQLAQTLLVSGELQPVRAVRVMVPRFRERNAVPIQAMTAEGTLVKPGDALLQIDNAPLLVPGGWCFGRLRYWFCHLQSIPSSKPSFALFSKN
jgi:multidrug efflux pump subunit AcrA (membrane-fusion protein)